MACYHSYRIRRHKLQPLDVSTIGLLYKILSTKQRKTITVYDMPNIFTALVQTSGNIMNGFQKMDFMLMGRLLMPVNIHCPAGKTSRYNEYQGNLSYSLHSLLKKKLVQVKKPFSREIV